MLRNVVENAFVPTFLGNPDGEVVYANRAFAELLGYDPKELVGLSLKEIVHPDDALVARTQIDDLLAGKIDSYRAERRYRRKNGSAIWVLASAAALIDEATGAMRHLTIQAIDIDGRKRAEADLMETEHRWNSALEAAGQGVWDHRRAQEPVFYSRMWRLMRGFGAEEQVDSSTRAGSSRVHPDDRERIRSLIGRQDSGEIPYNAFEYRELHRDGHYIWILSRGAPVEWFPDGRPSRLIGTDTDITSLKKPRNSSSSPIRC